MYVKRKIHVNAKNKMVPALAKGHILIRILIKEHVVHRTLEWYSANSHDGGKTEVCIHLGLNPHNFRKVTPCLHSEDLGQRKCKPPFYLCHGYGPSIIVKDGTTLHWMMEIGRKPQVKYWSRLPPQRFFLLERPQNLFVQSSPDLSKAAPVYCM